MSMDNNCKVKLLASILAVGMAVGVAGCSSSDTAEQKDNTTRIEEVQTETGPLEVTDITFPGKSGSLFPFNVIVKNTSDAAIDMICLNCQLLDASGKLLQDMPVINNRIEAGEEASVSANAPTEVNGKKVESIKVTSYDILDASDAEADGYKPLESHDFVNPRVITIGMVPSEAPVTDTSDEGQE